MRYLMLILITVACAKQNDSNRSGLSGLWSNSVYASSLTISPTNESSGSLELKTGIGADCTYTYTATPNDPEAKDFTSGVMTISSGIQLGNQTESCVLTGLWDYSLLDNGYLQLCASNGACQWYQ